MNISILVLFIFLVEIGEIVTKIVTVYDEYNFEGKSMKFEYSRCTNILQFNDLASSVKTDGSCVHLWKHLCCQGESIEIANNSLTNLSSLNFDNSVTSVSPCGNYTSVAPMILLETWLGHNQTIQKVWEDSDITIYYNGAMNRNITWPRKYIGDVWRYVKKTYGDFGPEESRLHPVFHSSVQGSQYGFNSLQNYFDYYSDCRNIIDCVSGKKDGWANMTGNDLDIITHEISHIVEGASKGVHGSPSYPIWGDSKWAEIFIYDIFNALKMDKDIKRWTKMMETNKDNFPRENTYWFRDWFFPIYDQYGKTQVLNKYFTLLSNEFRRKENNYQYGDNYTMGEFVHFWSGAARTNLKTQATKAFGWPSEYETQFNKAREDFPNIVY